MLGSGEPIAIIGTGCQFPGGASTPSKLWDLLREPRDLLKPLEDRFNAQGWHHDSGKYHGHCNVKESYLLDGDGVHRLFDAQFFGINAVEANTMDPQMRLLLETTYEALEAAGQPVEALRGSDTAVYIGMMGNSYKTVMERDLDSIGTYHVSGVARAMMSNRLSYFFDWHGPSFSSLIAVHQAVEQLRSGRSHVAVAAGSNLLLDSPDYVGMSKLEMLSHESRSRMWDQDANGYARGEGVAAVVLKPLSAAIADGDHIECIIRETATNQDGRTPGITMPSATAQAQLMRDCYSRAGLDPTDPAQRPQYFEAHGTGTQAGDHVEAQAITTAFFPGQSSTRHKPSCLFVGGVKTVIGHSESVAGLAGLIKTSLALQHALIPPNLMFNHISPKVEPFYANLQIPTSAVSWPVIGDGVPRRASLNSFGFGGSNAHAILESHTPDRPTPGSVKLTSFTALSSNLAAVCEHLWTDGAHTSMRDLALTLHARRSRLPYGTAIAANTVEDLCNKLQDKCSNSSRQPVGIRSFQRPGDQKHKILGIFTGQGAQSPHMGAALIQSSEKCRSIIDKLERRLSTLPAEDRPAWSLKTELLNADAVSISRATLSQPLCTALQIMQVDLLRAAGVQFSAVVGHSSGEIGAAYCAGWISAEDAICIAYYRGLHSHLAVGSKGQRGAMLAVGTSSEDAQELCDEDEFQGRVSVAAVNSTASVTLSGDDEAIEEIKIIYEDEKKFVRRLKVDKAYHSQHMVPCSRAYLRSLQALDIQVHEARVPWFSSVAGGTLMGSDMASRLAGPYWNDNMVQTVKFMQAIEGAWTSQGPFDMAVEIGPHPALKGPALQTIQDISTANLPYTGVHYRGENAVESFANALGQIWTQLGTVDLLGFDTFITGRPGYEFVTGLPKYAWDHEKEYWHESRYGRAVRTRSDPVHELLGHLTPDSTEQEMRWRNILCPKELPWLKGHALQEQVVFPAAGYVVAAVEAAAAKARSQGLSATLIEVLDLDIGKALAFDSDDTQMETITSMADIPQHGPTKTIEASFRFHAAQTTQKGPLNLLASGHVRVSLGDGDEFVLPPRGQSEHDAYNVGTSEFYDSLANLEYQYDGPFRALSGLRRKLGFATGFISNEPTRMLIHPAVLDAAFQSVLLAHCAPNSGGLWSLHVPKTIRAVRVNPHLCLANTRDGRIPFDCMQPEAMDALEGDVGLFAAHGSQHAMVQVEALQCVPFARAKAQDDRELFAVTVWDVAVPDAEKVAYDGEPTTEQVEVARIMERMAVFFLRQLDCGVPRDSPARFTGAYPYYFEFATHIISLAKDGKLPLWSSEWENDTLDQLSAAYEPHLHSTDVRLLKAVGENIIDIVTGRKQAIEVGMRDGMLSQFYEHAIGMQENTRYLARLVKQVVHRYPHLNVLEVGAGTGGATKAVFQEIGRTFSTYTFTDISSGFFESAKQVFAPFVDKMTFKVLDIGKDARQQGFSEHSYDLIVASAVLHATPNLQDTLRNVRRLLKPGGFLVVLELQFDNLARMGTIFGAFPGWWLGAAEGRTLSPCVDLAQWDHLLRNTGFSGCDTVAPVRNSLVMPPVAVNGNINFLRDPLSAPVSPLGEDALMVHQDLLLLGGSSLLTSRLVGQLKSVLGHYWRAIKTARTLSDVVSMKISSNTTVMGLVELDGPVFEDLNNSDWEALKTLLHDAGTILWVSRGRRAENPYANMLVGLVRSARKEIPTLDIQCFDVEAESALNTRQLAETLLRLRATTMWQRRDGQESMLMTVEPELIQDQSGSLIIPRVISSQEMNDWYNSLQRPISKPASIQDDQENVGIMVDDGQGVFLRQEPMPQGGEQRRIRATHSLCSAVRVARLGFMHLILGQECLSGDQVAVLSSKHTLMFDSDRGLAMPVVVEKGQEAAFVTLLAHHLLSSMILEDLAEEEVVIIHEPKKDFAVVVAEEAERRGVLVQFTSSSTTASEPGWYSIHPASPDRVINAMIPANTAAFLDLSGDDANTLAGARLRSLLPSYCRQCSMRNMFSACTTWAPHGRQLQIVQTRLRDCVSRASAHLAGPGISTTTTVCLDALAQTSHNDPPRLSPLSVIDWSRPASQIPVQVQDAGSQVRFSSSKTYWLAGLSGGLGLLLCEWMVRQGAKYVVISSRRPKVAESWLAKMRSVGAHVKVFACDITDKAAVSELYSTIQSTMPVIAGVCQGAMVLNDTTIRDMSLEALVKVTRPKVEGSLHLGQLFQGTENPLEFFIFFSSAGSVPGQPGQGNYAAANLFMTALAERRRRQGQAASVMHLGPVFGVGYITQQGAHAEVKSVAHVWVPISEQVVCQHFSAAVIAGRPGSSPRPLETTTGLAKVAFPQDAGPFMSHYTQDRATCTMDVSKDRSKVPLQTQLAEAQGRGQVARIIREAFLLKLSILLQSDLAKLEQADPASLRLDEMGLDSLMAVEIRGWFVKTLQVNIPVLKLLSGALVSELVDISVDTMPRTLVPNIDDDAPDLATAKPIRPPTPFTPPVGQAEEKDLLASVPWPGLERVVRLSFSQSLFWFSAAFSDNPANLNLTATFRLTGKMRVEDLKRAVLALGQQHESLRTRFVASDSEPKQGIMKSTALRLEHYTIRDDREVDLYTNDIHSHVYDLESGKTVRLALVSRSATQHFFIIGVHHLAMDGASFQPLMRDLLSHYTQRHQEIRTMQYADFSEHQHSTLASGGFKDELDFWRTELADLPPTLPILRMSTLASRPKLQAYGNKAVDMWIKPDTKVRIQALCRRCRATPFHFYLAVFRVLLWRYSGAEEFSIGIGDANRTEDALMDTIGDLVNMLPLVFQTQGAVQFDALVQETRAKTHSALANSRVPFQLLLKELGVSRSAVTTPIFQAFIDYRLGRGETMRWGDCELELQQFRPSKLAYDVAMDIVDNADGDCHLTFVVRDDLYSQEDVEQLAKSYVLLASAFASQPDKALKEVDIFDEVEIEEALNLGRGPLYQSRHWGTTAIHRIDDMADKYSGRTAVISEDGSTETYESIVHHNVHRIASALLAAGVTQGSRVAVLQEVTPGWVSSILAIMRVGATYLPLDVGTPWARLSAMVQDAQPQAVLVDAFTRHNVGELQRNGLQVVDVSSLGPGQQVPISATSDGVATILYTSGSSGTPKGIVLRHRGVSSWLEPCGMLYGFRPSGEVVLQQSSQGFDMSLMQILTALCFGGSVVLLPRRLRGDARAISDIITRHGITHTFGTPSEYLSWLRYGDSEALRTSSWKTALVGGEVLAQAVLMEFAALDKADLRFHHMYGTTESTFCATVSELEYTRELSKPTASGVSQPGYAAGVALPSYSVYILDEQKRPLRAGMQGEIYIGGAGVGDGYLNMPRLTAETFLADPFATADDLARGWTMMQRTGDLGRWSRAVHHGAVLVEGRISGDTMVKLRGLRVDLREVEGEILRAGAGMLAEAVVSILRASADTPEFLVAHVVPGPLLAQEKGSLELHLPLMSSGKLDRKAVAALPLPKDESEADGVVVLLTATEEKLKAVWEDVLSHDLASVHSITPDTDFFHIGGTSLVLLHLRETIQTRFGVALSLVDLFEASVLSSMAHRIQGQVDAAEVIDWEEETALRPCMAQLDSALLQHVPPSQSRVVILTGGSGNLGKGLIRAMIADPTIKEIHCLGVRNAAKRTDMQGLEKVTLYEGDLQQPRIGLAESVLHDLFSRADLIIHNGADISYMKTYPSLRQSNFLVCKDLIQWSLPRMVPFHFISSAGVGNFAPPGAPLYASSLAASPPPTDGSHGYTAGKWASEVFLEKLAARHPRWPVCVHRPTLILRDDIPALDGAHNLLGYSRRMGA
ncbi:hypothetical protein M406DRAFT_20609, partial [Cryphonectria parasitica EP155]